MDGVSETTGGGGSVGGSEIAGDTGASGAGIGGGSDGFAGLAVGSVVVCHFRNNSASTSERGRAYFARDAAITA
jgi:hypothetical protein